MVFCFRFRAQRGVNATHFRDELRRAFGDLLEPIAPQHVFVGSDVASGWTVPGGVRSGTELGQVLRRPVECPGLAGPSVLRYRFYRQSCRLDKSIGARVLCAEHPFVGVSCPLLRPDPSSPGPMIQASGETKLSKLRLLANTVKIFGVKWSIESVVGKKTVETASLCSLPNIAAQVLCCVVFC